MHLYVHCGTVYNSNNLEPTQMPINDRLDEENVAHIQHGILCSHKKGWVHVLCRDMDESGNHHSQKIDPRTENQTLQVLTHKWVLNNESTWIHGGEHHTLGPVGRMGGVLGRDSLGRNAKWGWRGGMQQNTLRCVYLCNYLACSAHVPQNLRCNKKNN